MIGLGCDKAACVDITSCDLCPVVFFIYLFDYLFFCEADKNALKHLSHRSLEDPKYRL